MDVGGILAVVGAACAVAGGEPEGVGLAGIRALASAMPVRRSGQLG